MKKLLSILGMVLVTFLLTGCVKFKYDMKVGLFKNVNISLLYAIDKSIFGDTELMDDEQIYQIEDHGFKVEEYKEGNYEGFKITKKIGSIDKVSSENDTSYSLSGFLEDDNDSSILFKVEKGLFKNKYIAKFIFDSSDSSLNSTLNEEEEENNDYYEDDYDLDDGWFTSDNDDSIDMDNDFSEMEDQIAKSLDLSFTVKLPYKSISSNAESVSKNGKELSWKLSNNGTNNIEFSFELYNPIALILIAGIPIIAIIALILIIINKKKQNRATIEQTSDAFSNSAAELTVSDPISKNIEETPNSENENNAIQATPTQDLVDTPINNN